MSAKIRIAVLGASGYTGADLVRLAITHLALLTEWAIGEDASLRMLDLPGDSHFPDTRHPDELPPVTDYEIGRRVSTLESYVHAQRWADTVAATSTAIGNAATYQVRPPGG